MSPGRPGRAMRDEQEAVAHAEQRLNEILATTLDEVAEAEELERERAHKVSMSKGALIRQQQSHCESSTGVFGEKCHTQQQVDQGRATHSGVRPVKGSILLKLYSIVRAHRPSVLPQHGTHNPTGGGVVTVPCGMQETLNLVKKTTFWEFRVEYTTSLGVALRNARYVEVLSVAPSLIADAIVFMAVCWKRIHALAPQISPHPLFAHPALLFRVVLETEFAPLSRS